MLLKAGLEDLLNRCKEDADGEKANGHDKPSNGLDLAITENGGNLSSGER